MVAEDHHQSISERIRELLAQAGLNPSPFAEKVGINKSNFSRLLRGERKWSLDHLERVSQGLGVSVSELISNFHEVPVLREISAVEPFDFCHSIEKENRLGTVPAPRVKDFGPLYGIRFRDDTYTPYFNRGSVLIVQKDTSDQIKTGDLVIYCDPKGTGHIGRVTLYDHQLLLEVLSPRDPRKLMLDRGQLRLMDRIIIIRL
jgi:transcriptional regulator with XRE-family HTH domain